MIALLNWAKYLNHYIAVYEGNGTGNSLLLNMDGLIW
jgi:hypothetical protein